jgi:DNA-directed RNA polymerase subunit E'
LKIIVCIQIRYGFPKGSLGANSHHLKVFSVSTLEDIVRIPPNLFGTSLNKAAINILKSKYESMVKSDLGYIIMILNADVDPMGKIIAGDGATFHRITFDALTFYPKLQEIIYGELVDITDFGAFVRIGPTDALLHLSQVMDDYLKSNIASGVILANQSGRTLKIGSTIRTRITAVSIGKASTMGKIGITCRQPFLGADEWIEEDLKKASGVDEKEKKVEGKKEEKVEAKKEEKVEAKKEEKVEVKEK